MTKTTDGFGERLAAVLLALFLVPMASMSGQPATAEREKVLFDCDIGSDIDDAYALALLLASPEIELVGVTVGHARTADRAPLALRMLRETGLDHIPVYVGRETALVVTRDGTPHEQFSDAPTSGSSTGPAVSTT